MTLLARYQMHRKLQTVQVTGNLCWVFVCLCVCVCMFVCVCLCRLEEADMWYLHQSCCPQLWRQGLSLSPNLKFLDWLDKLTNGTLESSGLSSLITGSVCVLSLTQLLGIQNACTASIWLAESPVQTPNVLILNTALGIFVHHIEKQKGKPQRMSLSSEPLGPKRLTLTSDTALRQGWLVRCTFSCTHASLGSSAARSPQRCFPGQFRNGSLEKDGGATREKQKGL